MEGSDASGATKVWLIENDRVVRMVLAEMLSNAGLHVAELPDGERLFEPEPPVEPPRVIVTDLDLGATCHDGLEVAGQARRCWPDVGVVFITGQPSRLNEHRQGERDRFVVKPFRSAQLVEAVVSLLQT
jgi:two-component system OmpR family response regulator